MDLDNIMSIVLQPQRFNQPILKQVKYIHVTHADNGFQARLTKSNKGQIAT